MYCVNPDPSNLRDMTVELEINEKRSCIICKVFFKDLFLTIENGDEDISLS